ncbi:MAG: hypothetical protein HN712_23700 [Gemmatimonadetes bacterium]|jgi:hypothetical protein|nr:hypothetical protein [Gemmatimonadota bacterium]MBT7863342.1 hypothetical protein [Gemmatimonadota bacterium]
MAQAVAGPARRVLLALGSVLIVVLAAEILLAWLAPQIHQLPHVWEFDQTLGWRHRAGASGRLRTPEFDVPYQIDDAGRRIRRAATVPTSKAPSNSVDPAAWADGIHEAIPGIQPDALEPPHDKHLRISLYGDSFAEGWGVEAEQSLAGQLETTLRDRQVSATVLNYGTAGYGTDQELLLYSSTGRSQDSDIVLVLFYGNDLWNNSSRQAIGVERGDKPFFSIGRDGLLRLEGVPVRRHPTWDRRLAFSLVGSSHLASLVAASLRPAEIPVAQQAAYYAGLYGADSSSMRTPQWELTCRLLKRFHDTVTAEGERCVVIYAPSVLQVEPEAWASRRMLYGLDDEYDLMKPNQTLAAWATEADVPFLDLTPAFLQKQQGGTRLFYDDSHWRRAGHHLAAVETAAFLDSMNWLH